MSLEDNLHELLKSDFGKKCFKVLSAEIITQDPDVQSVVSLTSSLRVISLTVLADSKYNILIFFAKKM